MKTAVLSSLRLVVGALLGFGLVPAVRAQDSAQPTTIHAFDGIGGSVPGQLALGDDGNFYGTTAYGGFGYNANQSQSGYGTVFRITPAGVLTTLYAFPGGVQGQNPHALVRGTDGNFYGLTSHGGAAGNGTVFRLTPAGELTTLYSFTDGAPTNEPLVQDDGGNFYGVRSVDNVTTHASIFRLTQTGGYTTLYTFTRGGDGSVASGLTRGSDGNFYGTSYGGANAAATIFRITPAGGFTVLYTFAGDGVGNSEGYLASGLTLGSDGNFYGSSPYGGTGMEGLVYRLTPAGDYTVLYSFGGGADGRFPGGRLVEGKDGNFYGLTNGSTAGVYEPAVRTARAGVFPLTVSPLPFIPPTVFRITPQGVLTSLYASNIFNGFILGGDGNFYGADAYGGTNDGFVFRLSIVPHPAFFTGQVPLVNGLDYLAFAGGNVFGYYAYTDDPNSLYHLDLGPEYLFDAQDGQRGLYLYDFRSGGFFYTSPTFPFPYLYDFSLESVVYYFPDQNNPGRYNSTADGKRYFYVFRTGTVVLK